MRRRALRATCLAAAAAALLPLQAAAQDPAQPSPAGRLPYVFAKLGTAFLLSDDLEPFAFGAGPAIEAGAGIPIVRHVAVEAGGGWLRLSSSRSVAQRTADTPSAAVEQLELSRELTVVPLVASVRLSGGWGPVEVFGLVGAGAYLVALDGSNVSSLSGSWSFHETDATVGSQAGAGVEVRVSPGIALGAEARYLHARATFRLDPSGSTTVEPAATVLTVRLDGVVVGATVAYRF